MFYQKNGQPRLSRELFAHPTGEYRGAPFWSWNCEVTEEMVDEQIDIYEKMGFGGFHIHARTGLETPYMGERFMELVKRADQRAREKGMFCYLYDEDRYPSGAAGGVVTEDFRYRQRFMLLSDQWREGFCRDRQEFESQIAAGGRPKGYYLTTYQVVLDEEGCLKSYRRIGKEEPVSEGRVWHAYLSLAEESPWFNDQTYIDVFNKKAVERFIALTHQRYYQALGEEFGRSVPSIFTDEPQMAGKFSFRSPFDQGRATLSYTDDMNGTFQNAYGTELLDVVPEILWELPEGKVSVHRYHYHDHLAERFASAFSDTLGQWCQDHGIALTGHFMSERTLFSQILALSESMRLYRSFQLPGIDILTDAKEFTTAKQAVSVARQYGREGVMCECYGAMNWDFDFKGHKLQGDWLAALGITIRCHHLTFMSMEGESKRDWPASIGYQSPWYSRYSYVEDHFARLNTALTRGKAVVKVGVIFPIESYWISYGPNSQTQMLRDQLDENYDNITKWLLYGTIDFDLIDESLLPGLCPLEDINDSLPVGEMKYEAVLVPGLRTIRGTTLDRLEAFADAGGTVIFAGEVPRLADAAESTRAEKLAERCLHTEFTRAAVLEALAPFRTIELRQKKGSLTEDMIYQMREDNENRWLFLSHVNRVKNMTDVPCLYKLRIRGQWNPAVYDTMTGEIRPCGAELKNGDTYLEKKLYGEDSLLLFLTPGAPAVSEEPPQLPEGDAHKIQAPESCTLSEPNVLLLDYAEFSFDGGDWQEQTDILTIDNLFRKQLGLPRRQDKFIQPWRLPKETPEHQAALRFTFDSKICADGVMLAMERPENAEIFLNGRQVTAEARGWFADRCIQTVALPPLKEGANQLILKIPFGRKTNLEWCYLLGDFGVTVAGDRAFITERPEKIRFGDVVHQGLPFYTGNITYQLKASIPADQEQVILQVPHFSGSVMSVSVDGAEKGVIAYAPHKLRLGPLKAGCHRICVTVYGNRFNAFGTIHNANDEYRWYGPDAYRTGGTQWSDSYLLKPNGILSPVFLLYPDE